MTISFRCNHCAARYEVAEALAGTGMSCEKCARDIEIPFPPLDLPREVTPGGSVVHRHEDAIRDLEPASGCSEHIELISRHIEQHLGKVASVFHEVVSELVHIDVHLVPPAEKRPFATLVTSGMSDRPMHPPPDAEEFSYAELMICLPPDWPLSRQDLQDENNYWPVRWLKQLARFPHEYQTWLFEGHSIPNGDPPQAFADNTRFCGWLLFLPVLAPQDFLELKISDQKTIRFFAIYPLFEEEMQLKLAEGMDALINRFAEHGVTEVVDVNRANTCK